MHDDEGRSVFKRLPLHFAPDALTAGATTFNEGFPMKSSAPPTGSRSSSARLAAASSADPWSNCQARIASRTTASVASPAGAYYSGCAFTLGAAAP